MFNSYGKSLLTAVASVLMLVGGNFSLHAQSQIRGTVYDTDKTQPMAGATVVVEGKNVATITDGSGKFSVNAKEGDVLSVQFMGYKTQNVTVSKSSVYDIILKPDSEQLSEVIVTALGMKREKRSLGYAATEVTGEDLNNVQNSNWLSGMEGKVAGVQFNKASGPIGSTKVVVRGESSLDGNSSALYVVDGIPITSGTISNASGSGYSNQDNPIDFGDGASDLNPDDIESVTVLKGAAATALYGSRAGNGAVIITTKSGSTAKGVGVTYSSLSPTGSDPGLVEHAPMSSIVAPSSIILAARLTMRPRSSFPAVSRQRLSAKYELSVMLMMPITSIFLPGFILYISSQTLDLQRSFLHQGLLSQK